MLEWHQWDKENPPKGLCVWVLYLLRAGTWQLATIGLGMWDPNRRRVECWGRDDIYPRDDEGDGQLFWATVNMPEMER